jgi:hypothetical protein
MLSIGQIHHLLKPEVTGVAADGVAGVPSQPASGRLHVGAVLASTSDVQRDMNCLSMYNLPAVMVACTNQWRVIECPYESAMNLARGNMRSFMLSSPVTSPMDVLAHRCS